MFKNGTWFPKDLKSDHQRLEVPSRELDVYQDVMQDYFDKSLRSNNKESEILNGK